jgi:TatA/E family protein of Tat protein translocase
MGIGRVEIVLIIIGVIVILFFGAKRLPEWGRSIGQTGKELKKGFRDGIDVSSAEKPADKDTKDKTDTKKS